MSDLSPAEIAGLRREYTLGGLRRADLDAEPMQQFAKWFGEALAVQPDDPNAMTLATATPGGEVSARVVLLKAFNHRGFIFFTNYASRKGAEVEANPRAALNFHWPALERQICVSGRVQKISREESEAYFHSRPRGSQLGARASVQSAVVADRAWLEAGLAAMEEKFGDREVPLPLSWGGYLLAPERIEFWQGRSNRLHDRFLYSGAGESGWKIERLSP